jgi:hypothetical protein
VAVGGEDGDRAVVAGHRRRWEGLRVWASRAAEVVVAWLGLLERVCRQSWVGGFGKKGT